MKERLTRLLSEYGKIAITTYFVIFGLVLAGFIVAIRLGFSAQGTAETAGTVAAAYAATKLTQPLRIGATLVLTPLIARLFGRGPKTPSEPGGAP